MSHEKRFTRGERALIGVGILAPSLVLAWIGIDRKLNTVPEFVPPAQSIPVPNAQEMLRTAYTLRVNTWPKPNLRYEDTLKQPLPEREKQLAANQKAITAIRESLKHGYATPIDWNNPAAQTFPQYAEHRELARLLAFSASTYADLGDHNEAVRCALDSVEMGVLISGDGPLIGYLVGMACEAIGRKVIWEQLDSLSPAEAEQALTRLTHLEKRRTAFTNFLTVERGYQQKMISDLAHHKVKAAEFVGFISGGGDGTDKAAQGRMMMTLALADKGAAWKAGMQYYDALAAYWSRPYARGGAPKPPTDALNQLLLPVFEQAYFVYTRNQTDSALLRASLMLKVQGTPASFEAPTDPFGQNQPLRYEKTMEGFKLWSVGPDGKDDGGKPIETKNKNSRGYDFTQEGDVVARVNTF